MDWKTKRIIKLEEKLRELKDEVSAETAEEIEQLLILKQ